MTQSISAIFKQFGIEVPEDEDFRMSESFAYNGDSTQHFQDTMQATQQAIASHQPAGAFGS